MPKTTPEARKARELEEEEEALFEPFGNYCQLPRGNSVGRSLWKKKKKKGGDFPRVRSLPFRLLHEKEWHAPGGGSFRSHTNRISLQFSFAVTCSIQFALFSRVVMRVGEALAAVVAFRSCARQQYESKQRINGHAPAAVLRTSCTWWQQALLLLFRSCLTYAQLTYTPLPPPDTGFSFCVNEWRERDAFCSFSQTVNCASSFSFNAPLEPRNARLGRHSFYCSPSLSLYLGHAQTELGSVSCLTAGPPVSTAVGKDKWRELSELRIR